MADEEALRALRMLGEAQRERALGVLRRHLPDTVVTRVEAGHSDFLNEIRVCTVVFIGFPSFKVGLTATLWHAVRPHHLHLMLMHVYCAWLGVMWTRMPARNQHKQRLCR